MFKEGSVWADTPQRLLTTLIGLPIVLLVVIIGFPIFDMVILIVALESAREVRNSVRHDAGLILPTICVLVGIAAQYLSLYPAFIMLAVIVVAVIIMMMRAGQVNLTYIPLITLYIGVPLGLSIAIRGFDDGAAWIFLLLTATWMTDSFALLGGRVFGRRKLAPKISPGKTIEGAFIGYLCGVLGGLIVMVLGDLPFVTAIIATLIIPVLAIIGDLQESRLKRYFHVKDSGGILPGHGGILDRIDGLLLAAPFLYLLILV